MADWKLITNRAWRATAPSYPLVPPSNERGRPLGGLVLSLWHFVKLVPAVVGLAFCALDLHWAPIWVDEKTGRPDDGREPDGPQTLERVCSNPLCRFRLERSVTHFKGRGRAGI